MKRTLFFLITCCVFIFCACSSSHSSSYDDDTTKCEFCGSQATICYDDIFLEYVCVDCLLENPNNFVICSICGKVDDYMGKYDNARRTCSDCSEKYCRVCVLCEEPYYRNDMVVIDGYCLCANDAFHLLIEHQSEEKIAEYIEQNLSIPRRSMYILANE